MRVVPAAEFDSNVPTAFPLFGKTNLMGDMPVRLCAEGSDLVAYGFRGQRIAIPAKQVHRIKVHILRDRKSGEDMGSFLVALDGAGRVLLHARGAWGPGLSDVCKRLLIRPPEVDTTRTTSRTWTPRGTSYPVLRVRPRGWIRLRLLMIASALAACGLGAAAGVGLSLLLPSGIGGARDLIGIALAIAGGVGGLWVFFAARSLLLGGLRWAVTSLRAGGPAPAGRFLKLDVPERILGLIITCAVGLAIPVLLLWGPIILANSVSHGLRDSALVAELRQHGVTVTGTVINVPYYTTDDNGDQVEHDQPTLQYAPVGSSTPVQVDDPAIRGITWPMNPDVPVQIVYDPSTGDAAAVGQTIGSVWHGAPTGNVIGGAVALVLEPPLIWWFYRRCTASRRKAARDFAENLA